MAQPKGVRWASEPRTLIKHQIYRRYVDCWMGKILQRFPRATIVDAFAGPGSYSDGPDGSPVVIAKAFLGHSGRDRFNRLHLICNESDPERRQALAERLAEVPQAQNLQITVRRPAPFAAAWADIVAAAHPRGDDRALPALWVLDPFDIKSVPFELVSRCLASPRDEVLITWFVDEIYRFCEKPEIQATLDAHYGGGHWRNALSASGEHHRKAALTLAYRSRLESLPNVKTSEFSITSKNTTARYSIILATHSDRGLECWNPVKWGLDPSAGRAISEKRGIQDSLWDDRSSLRDALERRAGTAVSFSDLRTQAARLGFLERHLRTTLDEMRQDGLAIREHPLDSRTPWPESCLVRFYPPA